MRTLLKISRQSVQDFILLSTSLYCSLLTNVSKTFQNQQLGLLKTATCDVQREKQMKRNECIVNKSWLHFLCGKQIFLCVYTRHIDMLVMWNIC